MKRKIAYLAAPLLFAVLAVAFFVSPHCKAQGASPCVRTCQEAALSAAQACNGDLACLQAVRVQYIACVSACRP